MVPKVTFRSPDPQPESPAAKLVDSKEELAVVYFSSQVLPPNPSQVTECSINAPWI